MYLKVTIDTFSKLATLQLRTFTLQTLQLENQRFGSKTVCCFSIILTLKGILTF